MDILEKLMKRQERFQKRFFYYMFNKENTTIC